MAHRRKRILVAEDDPFVSEMLKCVLVRAGYEVVLVDNADDAIEGVEFDRPDLVLTDLFGSGMGGLSILRASKHLDSPPKVVMLTSSLPNEVVSEMRDEYGVDDVLQMPFRFSSLLTCISRHLPDGNEKTRIENTLMRPGAGELT